MNKKKWLILTIVIFLLFVGCIFGIFKLVNYLRVKYAKIEITLTDNLNAEFTSIVHVSDFITSINGTILNDYEIDTNTLGEKEVEVSFLNNDHIKVKYNYTINVIDSVSPVILLGNTYTITLGSNINLVDKILCGDNEDENPSCYIEGDYNKDTLGSYPLTFKAIDRSGNTTSKDFTLKVVESTKTTSNNTSTYFSDVIKNYKTANTKIGIDISKWQGDIDFNALKDSGVEFAIVRVGYSLNNEYYLDAKFKQNMEGLANANIATGIYFYSYANSQSKSIEDALWVLDQIKDYDITLPIAIDWEDWNNFNEYHLSFFGLTNMAESFLDTITNNGYQGMIYSSKKYLDSIWLNSKYDIWLAHYTNTTDYQGKYLMWQMCSDGIVDGIDGAVDIDILYN